MADNQERYGAGLPLKIPETLLPNKSGKAAVKVVPPEGQVSAVIPGILLE